MLLKWLVRQKLWGEVPVGAILIDPRTDFLIAADCNHTIEKCDPTAHAEIMVLRNAAKRLNNHRLTGYDLYVTLEPCAMCSAAISHARISRLIFATEDIKGGAVMNGVQFFQQPSCHWKPEVFIAGDRSVASSLLKDFFKKRRK